jgi:hypothetical protein
MSPAKTSSSQNAIVISSRSDHERKLKPGPLM